MSFKELLNNGTVYFDGGMGTLLQKRGLLPGECPERWNITHKNDVIAIHKAYYDAGSNVVTTNTFGANILKFSQNELSQIIKAAIENADTARKQSENKGEKLIALDIGPTGRLLKPLGDLDFEKAVEIFKATAVLGEKYGADLIVIETMNDSYETKAALLAVKESTDLPVVVTNAYGEDGKLMTGASPAAMVALIESMGADALGANCSLGPKQLKGVVNELLKYSSIPVMLQPNAGLPVIKNGQTLFDVTKDEFAGAMKEYISLGVRIAGGCCGTTPEYIKEVVDKTAQIKPKKTEKKNYTFISSYTHAVFFGDKPLLIGERINPTGKKLFKEALKNNDINYILNEGVNQQEKGAHILDVNVGLPEIDEKEMLCSAVTALQAVTNLPLQLDSSDPAALEAALRLYNGKPLINSVNGKKESMEAIFPLAKKYGGAIIALTLDEKGIPETAEGRVDIAKRILKTAEEYGIDKRDIIFDTLALTISADKNAALATLEALSVIKSTLGCHTSLGVSNVSFGLPCREVINSTFFALALQKGLSAAIMNPYSWEMMKTYYAFNALCGKDENCESYIEAAKAFTEAALVTENREKTAEEFASELQKAIIKGFKDKAGLITAELLKTEAPLEVVNGEIIPALNTVGKDYENKKAYLPQLLMSAEAAQSAFNVIKSNMETDDKNEKATFVIATVKGDIHDIGKNIVKLLLSNYGFKVIDLGKDVDPYIIVNKVIETKAPLLGLSALMTTTVPAMEETVALVKAKAPFCRVIVGGAVLTKEYADKMGAHKYAKDAMETVRYAESVI
ncbi:MAG: homocysteine S-methyltransferase family protein [Clostridia bacterium]|nr:homocysteine S-methyltransferase family protein [Clostridia bacterium]